MHTAHAALDESNYSNMRNQAEQEETPGLKSIQIQDVVLGKSKRLPKKEANQQKLKFFNKRKLYGRQTEELVLAEAYDRCTSGSSGESESELVLITGKSGTGKSRLADSLRAKVVANGGFFISGKFDYLERPESSYPLIRAFTDFVLQLTERPDQHKYKDIYKSLQEIMDSDYLLPDMIPALRQFRTNRTKPVDMLYGVEPQIRIEFAFSRLLQAICNQSRHLVFFLDDLQWGKPEPLNIMFSLVKNSNIKGFMLVGACRGNEVSMKDHLSVKLRDLEDSGRVVITDIRLSNLDEATVERLVFDALGDDRQDLATLIWKQGGGNIFFTIQLIRKIISNCSVHRIESRYENAVDLLTELIRGLPQDVQDILRIASCFGAEFDAPLLEELVVCDVEEALARCEAQELIFREQDGRIRFAHDQIQQSAYSLIPDGQREATHLDIGRRLWESLSEQELKTYGFSVVRQLRLGASLMTAQDERYKMAALLLGAGVHAKQTASFAEAASHFERGISLLGARHWRDEYYLSLDLYNGAADSAYCNKEYDRVLSLTSSVIADARQNRHKIKAYILQMNTMVANTNVRAAVDLGLHALSQCGYALPRKVGLLQNIFELTKTKRMLKRFSNKQIKQLPRLEKDSEEAAILNLMLMLHPYVLADASVECVLILPLRAVQMVLKHGLCDAAPITFGALGLILANHLGDFKLGWRLAQLSMDLLHQLEAYWWQTRVVLVSHSYVFAIQEPLKDLLAPLQAAHLAGLTCGDIEMAMVTASNRAGMAIVASVQLRPLIDDMKISLNVMVEHQGNESLGVSSLLPCYQFVLNMVYPTADPVELTGEVMNEHAFQSVHVQNPLALSLVCYYKLLLACYFHSFKFAEHLLEQVHLGSNGLPPHMRVAVMLYSGIVHAELSNNRTRLRLKRVQTILRTLKRFVRFSEDKYDAQIHMLEAEVAGIRGETDDAVSKFKLAIDCAKREGYLNLVGLASERVSSVLDLAGRPEEAQTNLLLSINNYRLWGADAKVAQLLRQLPASSRKELGPGRNTAL